MDRMVVTSEDGRFEYEWELLLYNTTEEKEEEEEEEEDDDDNNGDSEECGGGTKQPMRATLLVVAVPTRGCPCWMSLTHRAGWA